MRNTIKKDTSSNKYASFTREALLILNSTKLL